ncbi:phospholipid-binding protein [Oculatella sp. LEGE 06141]|uniref:BON domain-containing protein n=1 Tax=Oculatella sp. LEGE 06141 TaxID=1828648 RepID=UPI00187E554F|nr:BON domain-containing protein [Oculatella sp. LEGE 06141]MBE9181014.1 phospholipid-binding protein [Oculatella sp. LEGE 06141]
MNALPSSSSVRYRSTSEGRSSLARLFTAIPPERVGLHGEYDHSGLAKRVALAFNQNFAAENVKNIRISQRGAVVVLVGQVPSQHLLNDLVRVALNVNGTADVEVNGLSVVSPCVTYLKFGAPKVALSPLF